MWRFAVVLLIGLALGAGAVLAALGSRGTGLPVRIGLGPQSQATSTAAKPAATPEPQPTLAPTAGPTTTPPAARTAPSVTVAGGGVAYDETLLTKLYDQVSPSVVFIRSLMAPGSGRPLPTPALPGPPGSPSTPGLPIPPLPGIGTGSGIVLDQLGNVLTNNHVVQGATKVEVILVDGSSYAGTVVGRDPSSDLAVVKVDAPANLLKPVTLGDSAALKVGQLAIAIGNPYGYSRTLTLGVVSGLGRPIPGSSRRVMVDMVQTDAALNPGNSGGPLLNSSGEVVGINTAVERDQPGVGFAIPINRAKRFLPEMLAGRSVRHPWLGIAGLEITPFLADQYKFPVQRGVLVQEVIPGGPAAQAGLRGGDSGPASGDIILAADGRNVASVADLVAYADTRQVGDKITLSLMRGGQARNLDLVLGEFPEEPLERRP